MTQIAFTGDLAFTKHFSNSCNDENLLSDKVVEFLSSSDYTVVNVEGAISSGAARTDKPLTHANPFECVNWIKKINGNIWNLANNHSMDCDQVGLESTLSVAKENNVATIGAGMNINQASKPVIIEKDGGIGIVAVTYARNNRADQKTAGCFAAEDEQEVLQKIKEIKANNRWCIVVSHVGEEFSQMAMPYLRKRYKKYLKMGADIVVGHHPHVVQNYEKVGNKIIFYSLGNFIFDTNFQRAQKYTEYGVLIKLKFTKDDFSWEFLSIKNNRENMTIHESEKPQIFCNISSAEYNVLWPLAARHLANNNRKKQTFHHPEYKDRSWLDWFFKFEIKRCDCPQGKNTMLGRFLSLFGLWRFANKKTVEYIREK